MDEIEEELEFQEFMGVLAALQEEIFWNLRDTDFVTAQGLHNDIMRFGTEPVFGSIIFDQLLAEQARSDV